MKKKLSVFFGATLFSQTLPIAIWFFASFKSSVSSVAISSLLVTGSSLLVVLYEQCFGSYLVREKIHSHWRNKRLYFQVCFVLLISVLYFFMVEFLLDVEHSVVSFYFLSTVSLFIFSFFFVVAKNNAELEMEFSKIGRVDAACSSLAFSLSMIIGIYYPDFLILSFYLLWNFLKSLFLSSFLVKNEFAGKNIDTQGSISYAKKMIVFCLSNMWCKNADNYIVGFFFGEAAIASYSLAYKIVLSPVTRFTGILSRFLIPYFTHNRNKVEVLSYDIVKLFVIVLVVCFNSSLIIAISSEWFVTNYMDVKWHSLLPMAIQVLAFYGASQALVNVSYSLLVAAKKESVLKKYAAYSFIVFTACFVVGGSFSFFVFCFMVIVAAMINFVVMVFIFVSEYSQGNKMAFSMFTIPPFASVISGFLYVFMVEGEFLENDLLIAIVCVLFSTSFSFLYYWLMLPRFKWRLAIN